MGGRCSPISDRKVSYLCACLLLALAICRLGHADEAETIQASTYAAAQLYHSGDVFSAKKSLEEIILKEPTPDSYFAYRGALAVLIEVCESVYDYGCVSENFTRLLELGISQEQDELQMLQNTFDWGLYA